MGPGRVAAGGVGLEGARHHHPQGRLDGSLPGGRPPAGQPRAPPAWRAQGFARHEAPLQSPAPKGCAGAD
eukprot:3558682-Lingulodinium_polyedra.AAC.1